MTPAHAQGIYEATVASVDELLPWMPWARDPSLAATLVLTQRHEREWLEGRLFHFALIERETGLVLGVAGLNREAPDVAELHYWIRSDHAGRGLTTEACRAIVGWARSAAGLSRLTLWAGRENAASRRVAAKLGFVHVGPLGWRPEGGRGTFEAEAYELLL